MTAVRGSASRRLQGAWPYAVLLVVNGAALWAARRPSERRVTQRPDIILVTLDTTRADHVGAYGYPRPISPGLDRFARDAVVFRRAWSAAPWTLPAHGSILTGQYPTSHGAHYAASADRHRPGEAFERQLVARPLPEDAITMAELLHDEGYTTGAFIGGPWLSPAFGLLQGYVHQDAQLPSAEGWTADRLTDRAIAWMANVPATQPLHVLVNYFDPHEPYAPPAGYDDLPAAKVPLTTSPAQVNAGAVLSAAQRQAFVDRYDGEIRFMDHHLARLLEALAAMGRYDGSLIIVVGDHGELFGEHGLMSHGHALYEGLLRVPLLVHLPHGRRGGTAENALVSTVDLLPLVAEEAGLPLPAGIDGLPIGRRREVLAENFAGVFFVQSYGARFDHDLFSVVRWPWKLIVADDGTTELYRLDLDPAETQNLSGQPPERDLQEALQRARQRLRAPPPNRSHDAVPADLQERLRALGYVR
jgi:arylsulfatase